MFYKSAVCKRRHEQISWHKRAVPSPYIAVQRSGDITAHGQKDRERYGQAHLRFRSSNPKQET